MSKAKDLLNYLKDNLIKSEEKDAEFAAVIKINPNLSPVCCRYRGQIMAYKDAIAAVEAFFETELDD